MNQYDYEDAQVECLNAAASCFRAASHAVPYLLIIAATGYMIQSVLAQPYALTCKTIPAEKSVPLPKSDAPVLAPDDENLNTFEMPSTTIKANPVRQD